jgi:hypothetical protein
MNMYAHARIAVLCFAGVLGLAGAASAATPSADLLRCQKKLEVHARAYAKYVAKKIGVCTEKVDACNLANDIDAIDPTACINAAAPICSAVDATIVANRTRRKTSIDIACAPIPFADVQPYLGSLGFVNVVASTCMVASTTALTDCLLDTTRCTAESEVFRRDPRAQEALTAAGVAASFPCVAP